MELRLKLGRAALVLAGSRTDYESSLEGFDRTVETVAVAVRMGQGGEDPW